MQLIYLCMFLIPFGVCYNIRILFGHFEQIVAFLGVLVYKFYGDELREMFGYEEHPYGFYTMAGKFDSISLLVLHFVEINF